MSTPNVPATRQPAAAPAKAPNTALTLMASRLAVAPADLQNTLMQTAFKGATPAEFIALLAVANQYNLNPLVREIYAFPKKGGGIVPLVPIDGWLKLIRENADFDGMTVTWSDELTKPSPEAQDCPIWVEVTIYHKSHPERPTTHREWIDEMYRNTEPWKQTTKRMLEWKGIIQAGRIAFGLSGIKDLDEAERISDGEIDVIPATVETVDKKVGTDDYKKLLAQAQRFGYTEEDVTATAATQGHEGPGADMPDDLAQRIYAGMKANPKAAEEPVQSGGFQTPMVGDGE